MHVKDSPQLFAFCPVMLDEGPARLQKCVDGGEGKTRLTFASIEEQPDFNSDGARLQCTMHPIVTDYIKESDLRPQCNIVQQAAISEVHAADLLQFCEAFSGPLPFAQLVDVQVKSSRLLSRDHRQPNA